MSLLGFVVISKNFLRTRKIMVMHSNERGECDLRTLVDRQRKRLVDKHFRLAIFKGMKIHSSSRCYASP